MDVSFFKKPSEPFEVTIERETGILPRDYYAMRIITGNETLRIFFDNIDDIEPLSDAIHCLKFGCYPNGRKPLTATPKPPVEIEDYGY